MEKIELTIEEVREIYYALFWATADNLADRLALSRAKLILGCKVGYIFEEENDND